MEWYQENDIRKTVLSSHHLYRVYSDTQNSKTLETSTNFLPLDLAALLWHDWAHQYPLHRHSGWSQVDRCILISSKRLWQCKNINNRIKSVVLCFSLRDGWVWRWTASRTGGSCSAAAAGWCRVSWLNAGGSSVSRRDVTESWAGGREEGGGINRNMLSGYTVLTLLHSRDVERSHAFMASTLLLVDYSSADSRCL